MDFFKVLYVCVIILLGVTCILLGTLHFQEQNCPLQQNQTTLKIYEIYQNIDMHGYIKCSMIHAFKIHFPECGINECVCLKNAVAVFQHYCFNYTMGIADSRSECDIIAKTLIGCNDMICRNL